MKGNAGRLVAERQECREWSIPSQPAANEFGSQQEVGAWASEGNAGCRDSDALQAHAPGCVQDETKLLKEDWHTSFCCHITKPNEAIQQQFAIHINE